MTKPATEKQQNYIHTLIAERRAQISVMSADRVRFETQENPIRAARFNRTLDIISAHVAELSSVEASALIDQLNRFDFLTEVEQFALNFVSGKLALTARQIRNMIDPEGYKVGDVLLSTMEELYVKWGLIAAMTEDPTPEPTPEPVEISAPVIVPPASVAIRTTARLFIDHPLPVRASVPDATEIARAAGELYALLQDPWHTDIIEALDPYYFDDSRDEQPRVTDWKRVRSVEHLLNLIEMSSGAAAADWLRKKLDFRYEMHEASQTPYIWGLDEGYWSWFAHAVVVRALELRGVSA